MVRQFPAETRGGNRSNTEELGIGAHLFLSFLLDLVVTIGRSRLDPVRDGLLAQPAQPWLERARLPQSWSSRWSRPQAQR
jgi:hypothetical protein